MQRHLRRALFLTGGVLAAATIAACGGSGASSSGSSSGAAHLLSQTSANAGKIHSGELSLTINADLNGLAALGGQPVGLQLAGPFTESAGQGTAFDFSATASFKGQTIPLSILSTGTALYLEFAGTYYSLPASIDSALAKEAQSGSSSGGSGDLLSRLGIDPSAWLAAPKIVGSATVGGVQTQHLVADVDVSRLLGNLAKVVSRVSGTAGKQAASELSPANLKQVESAINSARVDLYSGTADHIERELRLAVSFTIPSGDQSSLGGLTSGSLTLDATITDLNAPETITPPTSSQPLSSLLGGGLGSL